MSSQETRECLLCLRIPFEKVRKAVEFIFQSWIWQSIDEYDQAIVNRIAERATKLIVMAYEKDRIALCGKKPTAIMAAAIYLSGNMEKGVKFSKRMVARTLKIAEQTLGIRARQIDDLLNLGIMERTRAQERRKLYVCPFCEKTFPYIFHLIWHLDDGGFKFSFLLRIRMFNEDGILVDQKILEKMKRYPGICKRPPVVRRARVRLARGNITV